MTDVGHLLMSTQLHARRETEKVSRKEGKGRKSKTDHEFIPTRGRLMHSQN